MSRLSRLRSRAPAGPEPEVTVVAPAIANAIYNAVGLRVRSLPITPAAVRKELQAMKKT